MFVSLKLWVGFPIFNSILLKFISLFNKMHGLCDFETLLKIKIIETSHALLLPDLWFLSYNKKF